MHAQVVALAVEHPGPDVMREPAEASRDVHEDPGCVLRNTDQAERGQVQVVDGEPAERGTTQVAVAQPGCEYRLALRRLIPAVARSLTRRRGWRPSASGKRQRLTGAPWLREAQLQDLGVPALTLVGAGHAATSG